MCGCENQELRSPFPKRKQEFVRTPKHNIKKLLHHVDYGPVTGYFENGTEPASCIKAGTIC